MLIVSRYAAQPLDLQAVIIKMPSQDDVIRLRMTLNQAGEVSPEQVPMMTGFNISFNSDLRFPKLPTQYQYINPSRLPPPFTIPFHEFF